MIRFATIAIVALTAHFAFFSKASAESAMRDNLIYVHTARNAPLCKTAETSATLKSGTQISSAAKIQCSENQKAFLVFSNRTALEITTNTELEIESYKRVPSQGFDIHEENEKTRSILKLNLKKGVILSYGLNRRPTSLFSITTPCGILEVKSSRFIISVEENEVSILLLSGQATFIDKNGKSDFIQKQQRGRIATTSKKGYPMSIDYITSIEIDSLNDRLRFCKMAFESVEFFQDKNGKTNARRIVSPEFLNRPAR